jgi:hypothetical protein
MTLTILALLAKDNGKTPKQSAAPHATPSLGATKGASVNRDAQRRPSMSVADKEHGQKKAEEIAKAFTKENIARAAAGDVNALSKIDYYLRVSKSIQKYDAFIAADVKKRIEAARGNGDVAKRVKERDTVEDSGAVFRREVGRGLIDGGSTLVKAPVRIVARVASAVGYIVTQPLKAIPAMVKGLWNAGVDIIHTGQSKGFGAAVSTTLGKAEDTFFGFRSLVREQSAMHARRQERDEAAKDAKTARETDSRLRSSGYYKDSDGKRAAAAQYAAKSAQVKFDEQYERAANQTADSSFAMLSTAFIAGKGLSAIASNAGKPAVLGISMAPKSPIMSSLATKVKNIPAVSNGISKVEPVLSKFKRSSKSLVDENGQMSFDFDNIASQTVAPKSGNLAQKVAASTAESLEKKALALEAKAATKSGIRQKLYAKASDKVFEQAVRFAKLADAKPLAALNARLSFGGAKNTFTSLRDKLGKPLDVVKARFDESKFLGKVGYGALVPAAWMWKTAGTLCFALPLATAHGIAAAPYVAVVRPVLWVAKNVIGKPAIATARRVPAIPYAVGVSALPEANAAAISSASAVAGAVSSAASSQAEAPSVKPASAAIVPVLNQKMLLSVRHSDSTIGSSDAYKQAVTDAQQKLIAWANKSGQPHVQELASQLKEGSFDSAMSDLVKEFQKVHALDENANTITVAANDVRGLVVDGIIGPRTARALNAISNEEVVLSANAFKQVAKTWQRQMGPVYVAQDAPVKSAPASMPVGVKLVDNNGVDKDQYPKYLEVTEVKPGSLFALKGVIPGTKIYSINDTTIAGTDDLLKLLEDQKLQGILTSQNRSPIVASLRMKIRKKDDLEVLPLTDVEVAA